MAKEHLPGPSSAYDKPQSLKSAKAKTTKLNTTNKSSPKQRVTNKTKKQAPRLTLERFAKDICDVQLFLTEHHIVPGEIKHNDSSIMFPPIPSNPFPDAYPEEGYPDARPDAEQQQMDLEAEVSVYRALENLNRGLVVMQSFEYTPEQNSLFGNDESSPKGGETDFVVLGGDTCVILEVKRLRDLKWYEENKSKGKQHPAEYRRK